MAVGGSLMLETMIETPRSCKCANHTNNFALLLLRTKKQQWANPTIFKNVY
jgi:hypothetical protein